MTSHRGAKVLSSVACFGLLFAAAVPAQQAAPGPAADARALLERRAGPLPVFPGATYSAECSRDTAGGGTAIFALPFAWDSAQYQQHLERTEASGREWYRLHQPGPADASGSTPPTAWDIAAQAHNAAIDTARWGGPAVVQQVDRFLRRQGFAADPENPLSAHVKSSLAGADSVVLAAELVLPTEMGAMYLRMTCGLPYAVALRFVDRAAQQRAFERCESGAC